MNVPVPHIAAGPPAGHPRRWRRGVRRAGLAVAALFVAGSSYLWARSRDTSSHLVYEFGAERQFRDFVVSCTNGRVALKSGRNPVYGSRVPRFKFEATPLRGTEGDPVRWDLAFTRGRYLSAPDGYRPARITGLGVTVLIQRRSWGVWVPIYLLQALAVLPAAVGWAARVARRRVRARRQRAGQCLACGYDLRGCPGGRCPECGRDAPALPRDSLGGTSATARAASG